MQKDIIKIKKYGNRRFYSSADKSYITILDIEAWIKKGHKIQIQISSTWFPLFAVNPQKFMENPNLATKADYTKAFIKVFADSAIEVQVLK